MKKLNFLLISVFVCVFLFVSCGQEWDTEKSSSVTPFELLKSNDNDQGEDEGNGKEPPIDLPNNDNDQGEDEGNGKEPPIDLPNEEMPIEIIESENYIFGYGVLSGLIKLPDNRWEGIVLKSKAQFDDFWELNRDSKINLGREPIINRMGWVPVKFDLIPYDAHFFKDYNLVVVSLLWFSYGLFDVDEIVVDNNKLSILVNYWPNVLPVSGPGFTIIIPVRKDHFNGDVEDINVENIRIWPPVISPPKEEKPGIPAF